MSDFAEPVRALYESLSRGDPEDAARYTTEDFVFEDVALGRAEGTLEAVNRWRTLLDAFPDIRFRVDREFVAGDYVIQEQTVDAHHKGTFLEVPPTGASVHFRSIVVARCIEGRVASLRLYRDVSGFTSQFAFIVHAARVATILNRAFPISLLVGTTFTLINQLPKFLAGSAMTSDFVRIAFNFLVPFTVATVSALTLKPPKPGRIPGGPFGHLLRRRIESSIRKAAESDEKS